MPRITAIEQIQENPNDYRPVLATLVKDAPKFTEIGPALDHHGAGIAEIAQTIGEILQYGDSHSSRLQAAKLATELHGIGTKREDAKFVFVIESADQINLNNLFNPQRG